MRILSSASSNICLLLVLIAYSTAPLQADGEMSLTNFAASFDPVFATLLTQPEVQDELEISKSQSEELFAILTKYRDEWRKHAETFTKQVETPAKLEAGKEPVSPKNLRLMNQEYSEKILAILQPKQQGRFLEIYLRTRAKTDTASVLLLAIVRDKLKLADEQVEQLEKIQKKAIASNVKSFLDGGETVKGIKGTSIESLRELNKAVSRMQEKQQTSIKDSSVEALKVLNEEQNTTFEKIQGPAVPIKIAENSLDKDAELFKLNKTIDSVEQMIQIWKTAPLTELEQVYSVLLQGAKLTDEKRNAQVKQFENQLKQNQEKRLQLMRMDNSIIPKIEGNPSEKNRKENPDKDQEVKPGKVEVIELGKDAKLEMVLIPAGKFMMGSPDSEKGRDKKETQHEVTLTKPYYLGKYEVTQEQWETVMRNNPSFLKGSKLPVTNVSWNDCQEFIKKLNVKTDGGYRLPTEAEWEYACRAGTTTAYSFGDKITPRDANYHYPMIRNPNPIEPSPDPVAVGSYEPNAFGLYDMHGNISEWCEDRFGDNPAGPVTDPRGPATGWGCVMRGGSTGHLESGVRSSFRNSGSPSDHFANYGFRLARTADSKGSVASPTETRPDPTGLTPSTRNEQFTFNKQDSSRQSTTEIKPPVKEPITPEDINEYYGVVTVSHNTGRYGFCFAHHKDKQEAANHALSFCNARDAKVVLCVKNQWFALASGGGGAFGWAYGSDPDEVREKAINECLRFSNRARIVVMEHSNNKKHTNHNLKSTSIKPSWDKSDVSKDDIKRDYEKILDFHNKSLPLEVEKTIEELSVTRANVWKNAAEN